MVSRSVLDDAIATYNEYRSPMATAEPVEHAGDAFAVRFEGPFCRPCCDYDYFEDLIYELGALGEDVSSISVEEITYDGGEVFVVEYTVER